MFPFLLIGALRLWKSGRKLVVIVIGNFHASIGTPLLRSYCLEIVS